MAFSRAYKFTPEFYHFSLICKALSHPARIEIIHFILKNKKVTFKQINEKIPLQQSTVSQHIRFLREMNIIIYQDHFPNAYSLNKNLPGTCKEIIKLIEKANSKKQTELTSELLQMIRLKGSNADTELKENLVS